MFSCSFKGKKVASTIWCQTAIKFLHFVAGGQLFQLLIAPYPPNSIIRSQLHPSHFFRETRQIFFQYEGILSTTTIQEWLVNLRLLSSLFLLVQGFGRYLGAKQVKPGDLWKIGRFGRQPFFLVDLPKISKHHSLPKKKYTNEGLGTAKMLQHINIGIGRIT